MMLLTEAEGRVSESMARWLEVTAIVVAIFGLGVALDSLAPVRLPPATEPRIVDVYELMQGYAKGWLAPHGEDPFEQWCAADAMCAGERLHPIQPTARGE
jgi:hypothetical protein